MRKNKVTQYRLMREVAKALDRDRLPDLARCKDEDVIDLAFEATSIIKSGVTEDSLQFNKAVSFMVAAYSIYLAVHI